MTEKLDKFDVDYLRRLTDGANTRIARTVQHEIDALNKLGFNVDIYVSSINVKTLDSNLPKQIAEVKLNVSL